MPTTHFEFLLEEASMEAFLRAWLPRYFPECTFGTYHYQGKRALLRQLERRLKGYAKWIANDTRIDVRIVVIVDCDNDKCADLKASLEKVCADAGLVSKTAARADEWQVVTRIAIEELEAWYFGDWNAVRAAYPKISESAAYRLRQNPDSIPGGTWEQFEKVLKRAGYHKGGLPKIEAACRIGKHIDAVRSCSTSFRKLTNVLKAAKP